MSLHTLAKHVQQKGRGKDQMLVHMTPKEVQGLQALAKANGGSLTINPETGLAEAGFLEDVLPIVAMAAATYFTAGAAAPALSAALSSSALAAGTVTTAGGIAAGSLAGAGVGALGAAAQGKDVGKGALYGGIGGAISGGMGAYGGGAEAATAGSEAAQAAKAAELANQGASGQAMLDQTLAQSGMPQQLAGPGMPGGAPPSVPPTPSGMPQQLGGPGMPQAPIPPSISAPEVPLGPDGSPVPPEGYKLNEFGDAYKPSPQQQNFFERLLSRPSSPTPPTPDDKAQLEAAKSYYSKLGSGLGDTAQKGAIQSLPGLTATMGMNEQDMEMPGTEPYKSASTLSPDFQGYTPRQPKLYYQAQYTRYAASGGLMALAPGGLAEEKKKKQRANLTADRTMAAMTADQAGLAMLNNARYGANMTGASPLRSSATLGDLPNVVGAARGGLADLGGYSDGGRMLKGPGDGMSDSIPGIIGRKQPARLADGEFVVPADVVSHLGNGSTDAGAKRLYAMMDKVRQKRTGKKKQAPAVNYKQGVPV